MTTAQLHRLRALRDYVLGAAPAEPEPGPAEIVIPDDVKRAAELGRRVLVLHPFD